MMPRYTEISGDRRSRRRFEMHLPMRIKVVAGNSLSDIGNGKVLNMSSTGIAFETDNLLYIGTIVELSITWPVLLHGNIPVNLIVQGIVIRTVGRMSAVEIIRHEFRTQGRR